MKRYEEAFAAFDAALQLNPSSGGASSGTWFFLTHLDRDEEAEHVRQSKPKSIPRTEDVAGSCSTADDYFQRGLTLSTLGRDEEAISAYEECLRLDPYHLDVYEHIHFIHLAKGRHEQSLATFTRAVQAFPGCARLHICRAEATARLHAAGREINKKVIEDEIELMQKEKKLEPLRSSVLFRPIRELMQARQEWSGTPKQFKELLSQHFPDAFAAWYRSPRKYVEELEKIVPALHEEGIEVGIPPHAALVTITSTTTSGHPSEDSTFC